MNAVTTTEAHEIQVLPRPAGPDSASLMRIIEVSMSRQDFDIAKISALLEVKERWEASEARKAYVLAMSLFKAEPMEILKRKQVGYKTKDGDFVGYSHAELSDITEVVGPAMAKHGLSFRWDIRQENGSISVDCIVRHAQGHSETVTMHAPPDASGKKNAIQQVASAVTYLSRYTLLAATGMATKGMDDDGDQAGGEDADSFRLADWLAKAEEAVDLNELRDTKERGFAVIRKRNDADSYRKFKAAIEKRLTALQPREPGQEG